MLNNLLFIGCSIEFWPVEIKVFLFFKDAFLVKFFSVNFLLLISCINGFHITKNYPKAPKISPDERIFHYFWFLNQIKDLIVISFMIPMSWLYYERPQLIPLHGNIKFIIYCVFKYWPLWKECTPFKLETCLDFKYVAEQVICTVLSKRDKDHKQKKNFGRIN